MSLGLVAAGSAGCAVALAMPVRPRLPGSRRDPAADGPVEHSALLLRLRPVLVPLVFLGVWTLLGGPVGLLAGLCAAVTGWRALGNVETPSVRRHRLELEGDLPIAVHLLGACLAAGAATAPALETVGAAVGGAVGSELDSVRRRLLLGADPVTVWQDVARSGALAPLGRPLARAHQAGAPVTAAIGRLSDDLRAQAQTRRQARARAVEVRATAPVGLCLLPAFLLLGVVPLTVSVFSSLRLFG